jgi:thiosulfate/3-mercaptopyruvate sulfurtransferase
MAYTTLISAGTLARHLEDAHWAIVDCRFTLADPSQGMRDYVHAHIPGAVYADLDKDLSGPVVPGETGRHPLPSIEPASINFSKLGIGPGVQVVAYDGAGGAMAAGRLWWMLHWLGHAAAAVLDGGWPGWILENRPVRAGLESRPVRSFVPAPRQELLASVGDVEAARLDPDYRLFDARSAERYHGRNETIDPVAGHIPGAVSDPYTDDLTAEGAFRPVEELRRRYQKLLGGVPAGRAIFYCGSGVTSVVNLLALQHAGLGEGRLYAGSWSEWITDPGRAVAGD